MKENKKCLGCTNLVIAKGGYAWNKKYCSAICRRNNLGIKKAPYQGITATGTVGAIAELEVSADLMKNGFEVFRALSPSSPCDLLCLKNGKFFSIEVRTAYKGLENMWRNRSRTIKADILAMFFHHEKEIIYEEVCTKKVWKF